MKTSLDLEDDQPIAAFLHTKAKFLFWAVPAMLVAAFLAYWVVSHRHAKGINDFFQAEFELEQIQQSEANAAQAFGRLQDILDRHQELHPKYDGVLAQNLLKQDNVALGEAYVKQVLGRTRPEVACYADFSQGSLLIAKGQYNEALSSALALKARLLEDQRFASDSYGEVLRLHNLARIGFLSQELGKREEERLAWSELLQEFAKPAPSLLVEEMRDQVVAAFHEGEVSLLDYAKDRLDRISNS